MKVLLLNGSPKANGNTAYALSQMAEVFTAEGVETEILHAGNVKDAQYGALTTPARRTREKTIRRFML